MTCVYFLPAYSVIAPMCSLIFAQYKLMYVAKKWQTLGAISCITCMTQNEQEVHEPP